MNAILREERVKHCNFVDKSQKGDLIRGKTAVGDSFLVAASLRENSAGLNTIVSTKHCFDVTETASSRSLSK